MAAGGNTSGIEKLEAFDRAHLDHYTMQNQDLAVEVVGLFLAQLPATLHLLESATAAEEWKFATHALKGSAAAVGAWKLHHLAANLEKLAFPGDADIRLLRIQALKAAAAEFRDLVRGAYPRLA
jgi:HPt (histidine-containing phosphotransfer) domain-containing protein